jgi:hypothetical protein
MKKLLLFCLISIFPTALFAQSHRVEVSSAGEPVGYAYVLVGETVLAMTDASGVATIPAARLKEGDTLSARFVGMKSVPSVWDGKSGVIRLELGPTVIEGGGVTARGKDRSRQMFRRHVARMPTHGWYTGFDGEYSMRYGGKRPWSSEGKYVRNHVPGEDANLRRINTFMLSPTAEKGAVLAWQIQRNVLLVCGIAEKAVQFDGSDGAGRGMIVKYRGETEGQNVFLIIKPYFDNFTGSDDSFQTLIRVNPTSGIVTSSETVSRTRFGIWSVSAKYALYDGRRDGGGAGSRFIYVADVEGKYQERNPDAEDAVEIEVKATGIIPRHFVPEPIVEGKGN